MPSVKRPTSETSDNIDVKPEPGVKRTKGDNGKVIKKTPIKWTSAEDAIFAELAERILKDRMWDEVKNDGRLAHRKANGIYMRIGVMIKKMAK